MWWNIIKDSKQVSRTVGGIDWEKETIPEKDETTCKEKLLAIQKALKDWEPPNSKYKGSSHGPNPYLSTRFWYQDKNNSKPGLGFKSDSEWLRNEKLNGEPHDYCTMIVQYNSHWIKDLTEKEACAFLEELKSFDFNSGGSVTTPIALISTKLSDAQIRPHCFILYRDKEEAKFYSLIIGRNDEEYGESTIRELGTFIKQQL
jgi:hypothetical protein